MKYRLPGTCLLSNSHATYKIQGNKKHVCKTNIWRNIKCKLNQYKEKEKKPIPCKKDEAVEEN